MMELKVAVNIHQDNEWFIVVCEEYNLSAKSFTIEDALTELQRKLYEYLEDEQLSVNVSVIFMIKMPI
jgi:predicted RNase H-like HicB family nuclease